MQFEDLISRGSFAAALIANLLVTFVAMEGYRRMGSKDRGLYLLAIAASLGLICAFLNFLISYTHQTPDTRYLLWVSATLLSVIDMALWALASYLIVRNYTKLK
jgi:hypothetical protein